jgi:hypothetical protein
VRKAALPATPPSNTFSQLLLFSNIVYTTAYANQPKATMAAGSGPRSVNARASPAADRAREGASAFLGFILPAGRGRLAVLVINASMSLSQ